MAEQNEPKPYLALASREFRLSLVLLFLCACCACYVAFAGIGATFSLVAIFAIVFVATATGGLLQRAIVQLSVAPPQQDATQDATDYAPDATPMQQPQLPGATMQQITEQELQNRVAFLDFLKQVTINRTLGENTWQQKGMPASAYRACVAYLATNGVLSVAPGRAPEVRMSFEQAKEAVCREKQDPNYWTVAELEYKKLNGQPFSSAQQSPTLPLNQNF